ncbi:MAG TPA: hypothetical protein VIY29_17800 [Ktedonobacteraceae bacterium]
MGLEDSKDLSVRTDERANRFVDRTYGGCFAKDGCQQADVLSETWHELLGMHTLETLAKGEGIEGIVTSVVSMEPSSLAEDPWSELLHLQGVETVDLQQCGFPTMHVSLSDIEVEKALQIMQEHVVEEGGQGRRAEM